jgi:antitoxin component of MazEF toxin-antitoxin module
MIPVSDAYRTAVNADERSHVARVLVYFDGDNNPPVVFEDEGITKISLLEEAHAESGNPLGAVSSNELTLGFDNSARIFTPTNQDSPYFGKLKPNVLIRAYLGLETSAGVFEYVPLGVFRTGDWSAPSGSVEATVTCYDRLYELGEKDVPMLPVRRNTTIYKMFEALFKALGLDSGDDYEIDISLNQRIVLGWLPKGKVREALQVLAVAGNCNIISNRYGQIAVRSNFTSGEPVTILTDNDQIITAENPQRYLDTYSVVKVAYKLPYLKKSASLLKIESLTVPQGGITLQEIEFTSGPVAVVDQVRLIGARNARVGDIQFGAWSITIQITNTGPDETVTLDVTGRTVDMINSAYAAEDAPSIAAFGRKELSIDNVLIQSLSVAKEYATSLLFYVKDPAVKFSLNIRGDPSLEVGDIINLQDTTDKIGTINAVPIRFTLDYDGALSAQAEARKPIVPVDWVFVSPGLAAQMPRQLAKPVVDWTFISPGLAIQTRR